jgi:hypothetical protein
MAGVTLSTLPWWMSCAPVSALIRGWVLQGLASEQGMSLRDGIERLAADADRLRRLAAASEGRREIVLERVKQTKDLPGCMTC